MAKRGLTQDTPPQEYWIPEKESGINLNQADKAQFGLLSRAPKPEQTPPPISTNNPALNEKLNVAGGTANFTGAPPVGLSGLPPGATMTQAESDAQRDALERQRLVGITAEGDEQVKRTRLTGELGGLIQDPIFDKFGRAIQDVERERKQERGQTATVAGAQAQGMGYSSAISGFMTDLEDRYNRRRKALEQARNEALKSGNAQIYEMVENRIGQEQKEQEAKMEKLINAQAREREMGMKEEEFGFKKRQFLTAEQEKQKENLTNQIQQIAQVDGTVPDTLKQQLDQLYGVGFTDRYTITSQKAAQAKTQTQQIEAVKDIYSILNAIPRGQKIKIGDAEYAGIAEDKNNQIFQETDARGNVTFVTIDKATGQIVHAATGGKIGRGLKSSGGGSGAKETYFTRPRPDGTIGYYFGNSKNVKESQELNKQAYLEGVSKAEGVLGEDEEVDFDDPAQREELFGSAESAISRAQLGGQLDTEEGYEKVKENIIETSNEEDWPDDFLQKVLDTLDTTVDDNNPEGWNVGRFKGEG